MKILSGYIGSIFQDFESYLRTEIDLIENDIRLVLDEYSPSLITYEITPGTYIFKDLSEVLFNILQPENSGFSNVSNIGFDDISMKSKLVVRSRIIATRFVEKSFFSTILDFTSHGAYKLYNAYVSQKHVN